MVRAIAALLAIGAIVGACSSPVPSPTDEPSPEPAARDEPIVRCPGQPSAPATAAQVDWSGPVRPADGEPVVEAMVLCEDGSWSWAEPPEDLPGWLDIIRLSVSPEGQLHWNIELADWPPSAQDRGESIIGHGLVLDTTGDGVADYVFGIDSDAPQRGLFHVWVTDLETGRTEEQIGGPYGYPVEFSHPDEGRYSPPIVVFTLLGGSAAPRDLVAGSMRWYAWSSATRADGVVVWDYAPDTAWLGAPSSTEP